MGPDCADPCCHDVTVSRLTPARRGAELTGDSVGLHHRILVPHRMGFPGLGAGRIEAQTGGEPLLVVFLLMDELEEFLRRLLVLLQRLVQRQRRLRSCLIAYRRLP